MSKRRKTGQAPNLPQEVLDRARRQAAGELEKVAPEEVVESIAPRTMPTPNEAAKRINYSALNRGSDEKQSASYVQRMLANPTKVVTEEDLRADYGYVLNDLKMMGLLTVVLMFLMFALAQFI